MSLEVDQAKNDGHLYAVPPVEEEKMQHDYTQSQHEYTQSQPAISHYAPPYTFHGTNGSPPPEDERIMRLRRANTLLLVAAIIASVLAIVASAVGGSLAANRQNQITSLQTRLQYGPNNTVALGANDTAPAAACSAVPSAASSAAPSAASSSPAPLELVNNCTSFTSPFKATSGGQYTVHCGNDLTGGSAPEILGVYVYTFADCIDACSSYNAGSADSVRVHQTQVRPNGTCAAVAWNRALSRSQGNCWLKSAIQSGLSVNETVDVATLNS